MDLDATLRKLLLAAALFHCCSPAIALKITIPTGRTECISESVTNEHFAIPGGPRIDGRVLVTGNSQYYVPFVTVRVLTPSNEEIWQQQHVYSETHFNVGARGPGSYKVCFYNPYESRTDAIVDLVYFALAHLRRGSGQVTIPKGTAGTRTTEVAHADHMDEVKRTILSMSEFMQVVQGSQRYLQRKLERHQHTMESNRRRTLVYTGVEVAMLLAMAAAQVFMVVKMFSSGKVKISV